MGYIDKLDSKCLNVIVCATVAIIFGCYNKNSKDIVEEKTYSFVLQEFSIKDSKVDSVTRMVIHELYPSKRQTEETMALGLNLMLNDTIDLMYSFHYRKENELANDFIPVNNKRILGYADVNGVDVVLLTNINDINELSAKLSNIIVPKAKTKVFNDIRYSRYIIYNKKRWENGTMYEPLCWHFKYKDGVVSKPSGYLGY